LIDCERIRSEEQLVPIRRMQATIYFVKDWAAAIAFYRDVLGLKEIVNFPNRWAVFGVPGGGTIALQPAYTSATNHVSIEVTRIRDFVADLKAKGARVIEDICQQEHGETAMLEDPSGNLIALIDTSTSKFAHD
jgi:catechol 2,3-dioxygenase-like lactoylglutathione lyase family enzyme